MRAQRTVACVAAAIGLAAACGGGGDDDDGSGAGAAQPADDDPRTESERQADEDAAEAMVLTLDDLPPGWEEEPADDEEEAEEDDDEELQAELAECLGIDPAELDPDNPSATSPTFTSPDDEEISVEISFTPSADAASRVIEVLNDDATPGCLGDALQTVFEEGIREEDPPEGVEFGEATINRLSFTALGDESVAFRVTFPVSAEGMEVDFYIDAVFARVGRIGIDGSFISLFAPFDEDEAAKLVQTVIDRAPAEERG